jgi:hypothetical protein
MGGKVYNFVRGHLLEPKDDNVRNQSGNIDALRWIDASIAWDKAHPVRYRLWRIYVNLTTSPASHYRAHIYWPVRQFYERGRRGWSVRDTWSMDGYLSSIIPPMVEHLRDNGHGWPGDPMTVDEWNEILITIARGFRAHAEVCNLDYITDDEHYNHEKHKPMEDALMKEWKKGATLFIKWYGHLWD